MAPSAGDTFQTVTIREGDYAACVCPSAGGAVLWLRRRGRDLLRPGAAGDVAADPRNAACFPCAPWFGRIAGALLFEGRRWPLAPTFAICDPVNAIHGHGWVSPWTVAAQSRASVSLAFVHDPRGGSFPFPFIAHQTLALDEYGAALHLRVENSGDAPMPAGAGLHPYFNRSPQDRIAFEAATLWTPSSDAADGAESAIPEDLDFSSPRHAPADTVDCSFTGFAGKVAILKPGLKITMTSEAPILHLYAPADEDYLCLEPVTHLPGRFGGAVLGPGEALSVSLRISADD